MVNANPATAMANCLTMAVASGASAGRYFIISSAAMAPVLAGNRQAERRVAVRLFMVFPFSYRVICVARVPLFGAS
jgi:hypothetical protein